VNAAKRYFATDFITTANADNQKPQRIREDAKANKSSMTTPTIGVVARSTPDELTTTALVSSFQPSNFDGALKDFDSFLTTVSSKIQ
jgi:glutamine synthetase adenylyltransferase